MADILQKFRAQAISGAVLLQDHQQRYDRSDPAYLIKYPRQAKCYRFLREQAHYVHLKKKPGHEKAHYQNLVACGNVHTCPICAARISEHRLKELIQMFDATEDKSHLFVTYTIPHYKGQSFAEILKMFQSAHKRMNDQRPIKSQPDFTTHKELKDEYKVDGTIKHMDVTYGYNGWHIHSHHVYILDAAPLPAGLRDFRDRTFDAWSRALIQEGVFDTEQFRNFTIEKKMRVVKAFRQKAVNIQMLVGTSENRVAKYLTKSGLQDRLINGWGVEHEMTKSPLKMAKIGRSEHLTPFGILGRIAGNPEKNWNRYAKVFLEYAQGIKGTHYIHWERGLKARFDIEDKTNEEILDESSAISEMYGLLELPEWERIKQNKLRGFVIQHSDKDYQIMMNLLNNELIKRESKNDTTRQKRLLRQTG